jgi:hypothetical protein
MEAPIDNRGVVRQLTDPGDTVAANGRTSTSDHSASLSRRGAMPWCPPPRRGTRAAEVGAGRADKHATAHPPSSAGSTAFATHTTTRSHPEPGPSSSGVPERVERLIIASRNTRLRPDQRVLEAPYGRARESKHFSATDDPWPLLTTVRRRVSPCASPSSCRTERSQLDIMRARANDKIVERSHSGAGVPWVHRRARRAFAR